MTPLKLSHGFAFLTLALMASTPALADQRLALQAGEKVSIACAQGLTPLLQDGVVQCGLVCEMNVTQPESYYCDQGGCVGTPPVIPVKVTIKEKLSHKILLQQEYDAEYAFGMDVVGGLKREFSKTCAVIESHEITLYRK